MSMEATESGRDKEASFLKALQCIKHTIPATKPMCRNY